MSSDSERMKIEIADPVWIISDRGHMVSGRAREVDEVSVVCEFDDFEGCERYFATDEENQVFHKDDFVLAFYHLNEIWRIECQKWHVTQSDIDDSKGQLIKYKSRKDKTNERNDTWSRSEFD